MVGLGQWVQSRYSGRQRVKVAVCQSGSMTYLSAETSHHVLILLLPRPHISVKILQSRLCLFTNLFFLFRLESLDSLFELLLLLENLLTHCAERLQLSRLLLHEVLQVCSQCSAGKG